MNNISLDNSASADLDRTITWQYDNATKIIGTIQMLSDFFEASTEELWDSFPADIINIDTAEREGLIRWAKILGIDIDAVANVSDDFLRRIVKARHNLLNGNASIADYCKWIGYEFNNKISVTDGLDMSLSFSVKSGATLTDEEESLIENYPDVAFVYPSGVRTNTARNSKIFGLDGQENDNAHSVGGCDNSSLCWFQDDGIDMSKKDIAKATVSGIEPSYNLELADWPNRLNIQPIHPVPTVSYDGVVLEQDVDYIIQYGENNVGGEGAVAILGIGDYRGSITVNFSVIPIDIGDLDVYFGTYNQEISIYNPEERFEIYNDKRILPVEVYTKSDVKPLLMSVSPAHYNYFRKDVDFSIAYPDFNVVGTSYFRLVFKGAFKGRLSVPIEITQRSFSVEPYDRSSSAVLKFTVSTLDNIDPGLKYMIVHHGELSGWMDFPSSMITHQAGTEVNFGAYPNDADEIRIKSSSESFGDIQNIRIKFATEQETKLRYYTYGNVMSIYNFSNTVPSFGFDSMFAAEKILSAPELPAENLSSNCYDNMFAGCSELTDAPKLPAKIMAPGCYMFMFANSGITKCPDLPSTQLSNGCYYGMFSTCENISVPPELNATVLPPQCYFTMFEWSGVITSHKFINSAEVHDSCYDYMYAGCKRLKEIISDEESIVVHTISGLNFGSRFEDYQLPNLNKIPKIILIYDDRYQGSTDVGKLSFAGCSLLKEVDIEIKDFTPQQSLIYDSAALFHDCITDCGITKVKFKCNTYPNLSFKNWMRNAQQTGVFICDAETYRKIESAGRSVDTVPEGWQIVVDGKQEKDYLWFEMPNGGTITLGAFQSFTPSSHPQITWNGYPDNLDVSYSFDGVTFNKWNAEQSGDRVLSVSPGQKVFIWNETDQFSQESVGIAGKCVSFSFSDKAICGGDISSLINFNDRVLAQAFKFLFVNQSNLTGSVTCSSTIFSDASFQFAFYGSGITGCFDLIQDIIPDRCYRYMFGNCANLKHPPKIESTSVGLNGCEHMFVSSGIEDAPEIKLVNLSRQCCWSMFEGCNSLEIAPYLPAIVLSPFCYERMFADCERLKRAMAKLPADLMEEGCYEEMFTGCHMLTHSPEIMFASHNRSILHTQTDPMQNMFLSCESLRSVTIHLTSWNYTDEQLVVGCTSTNSWLQDVPGFGIFVCPSELPDQRGDSYIPNGWSKVNI